MPMIKIPRIYLEISRHQTLEKAVTHIEDENAIEDTADSFRDISAWAFGF